MAPALLRRRVVEERTGLNTTEIYDGMKAGTFPKSVPIGPRKVAWSEVEIDGWITAKIEARDNGTAKRQVAGPGRRHKTPRADPPSLAIA